MSLDCFGCDTTNNNYSGAGVKVCAQCGAEFKSYDKGRKYCCQDCYAKAKSTRETGTCETCGGEFKKHVNTRKYCSVECYSDRPKKGGYVPRPRKKHFMKCANCGETFRHSPSQKRKFCSYDCFLASGGARRAGDAAAMATRKYGAKKDANHKDIMGAIKAFTAVYDLSHAGFGVPDGIAWVNGGWQLFDIKNPKTGYGRRGLNKRQREWASDWRGGPVFLIYTRDEAERFAKGDLDELKRFSGEEQ